MIQTWNSRGGDVNTQQRLTQTGVSGGVVPQQESSSVFSCTQDSSSRDDSREASEASLWRLLLSFPGEFWRRESEQDRESCLERRDLHIPEEEEKTEEDIRQ